MIKTTSQNRTKHTTTMNKNESNQLRIGNYLQRLDDSIFQVTAQDILSISKWESNEGLLPRFIPLTEEILLRCGFEGRLGGEMVFGNFFIRQGENDSYFIFMGTKFIIELHNLQLHQLQNLYFALTGTELTLNQ